MTLTDRYDDLHSPCSPSEDRQDVMNPDTFFPSLSAYELHDLICRADSREEEALRIVTAPFEKLIISVAEENANENCTVAFLIDEGCLGLLRAIRWSAEDKKNNFPELAECLIREMISDAANPRQTESYLSRELMAMRFSEIVSRYDLIRKETGAVPSPESMGLSDEISSEDLEEKISRMRRTLEEILAVPDELSGLSFPFSYSEECSFDLANESDFDFIRRQLADNLDLSRLSGRTRKVLRLRFGLDGESPKDLYSIGQIIGITAFRVYQIEYNTLRRLGFRVWESGYRKRRT